MNHNLHEEMTIQRAGQGIVLVESDKNNRPDNALCIEKLMKMPFHMYFMDRYSVLQKFNERGAISFNLNHYNDAIGLSARDLSSRETAESSIANDRMVINNNQFLIKDEHYTRLDQMDFTTLSIKFPWYQDNKTRGVFGVSFLLDSKWGISLSDAMNHVIHTGLLDSRQFNASLPGLQFGGIYLTKRQKEIVSHMIRGKTAKEIANLLNLSSRTVEHHIENIKLKTDSDSRSELIDKMIDYFIAT